ncbi:uncharacterized protein LOC128185712 [Crassostrea angulata]|uniref:uncharacterized protein LOC128185712 n=1 Tax=Magallana angulata TaxID=2784310 RepID=UPI0022B1A3DA|nr:uncharacterized protein LOC128185712 [Crassostrea angulata]
MAFNVILATLGANACVVLATAVTGMIRGNNVSLIWNGIGVKVNIDNSDGEQPKTNKKQEGIDDDDNHGQLDKTMDKKEADNMPVNTPHKKYQEETEKVSIKKKKKKLKKIRKMLNWIRRRKS